MKRILLMCVVLVLTGACSTDTDADVISLSFDRNSCESELPDVAAGEHGFVVTNTSDRRVALYVVRLDEGRSFGDLIELQGSLGGPPAYVSMPGWTSYARRSFDLRDMARSDDQHVYAFAFEPGEHVAYVRISRPAETFFCGSFAVLP